jgi:hypothetical protein
MNLNNQKTNSKPKQIMDFTFELIFEYLVLKFIRQLSDRFCHLNIDFWNLQFAALRHCFYGQP